MPRNFKSETLARILNDASNAKPIDGDKRKNIYEPDEYNKKRAEILALDQVSNSEYLEPKHEVGAVEFDERGNLKEIGRNRPAMLDMAFYTRNRYEIERVIPANEKKVGLDRGTYILVVFGNAVVKAITDTTELPKNVKAYRFKRVEIGADIMEKVVAEAKDENGEPIKAEKTYVWEYVGAELILSERVYKMTRQLNARDAMLLMDKIEGGISDGENVAGDSLDDID